MIGEHAEGRVIQALDTGACIRLAQDLIRVPSVTGDERVAQDLVALALEEAGLEVVQSVVGEEDGGIGSFAMAQRGYRADAAFVLEPTRLRVIPAQAGALSFRLRIRGRSAHASVRYEGISAIEKFALVEARLRQLERSLNQNVHPLFSHYPIAYALSIG